MALIGIGQVTEESAIVKSRYFGIENIEEVKKNGAVANILVTTLTTAKAVMELQRSQS